MKRILTPAHCLAGWSRLVLCRYGFKLIMDQGPPQDDTDQEAFKGRPIFFFVKLP